MPNTLKRLREFCSQQPSVFRGYSKLRKADLLAFMREKIDDHDLIGVDEDGDFIDISHAIGIIAVDYTPIENAQDPDAWDDDDLLEVFEDLEPMVLPPPVGPPAFAPPPYARTLADPWDLSDTYPYITRQQYEYINDEIYRRVYARFTDEERDTMVMLNEGMWIEIGGGVVNMNAEELIETNLFNKALDIMSFDIFGELNQIITPSSNIEELVIDGDIDVLTEIVRRECITDVRPPPPECPVCYERKRGMTVETSCGHNICLPCLNKTWEARCGTHKWMDRPCPMCRAPVDNLKFII